uniref:Uncharacterized protein n=1 Tax=Electrophorus electricus TaxID=8005 RepID=A0AAY5EJN6_ELEEL
TGSCLQRSPTSLLSPARPRTQHSLTGRTHTHTRSSGAWAEGTALHGPPKLTLPNCARAHRGLSPTYMAGGFLRKLVAQTLDMRNS